MKYQSGEKVIVGDTVLIEKGKTTGIVKAIIETEKDMKEWSLTEKGVLIESAPFGVVFWPELESADPVVLKCR